MDQQCDMSAVCMYVGITPISLLPQDAECKATECRTGRAGGLGHQRDECPFGAQHYMLTAFWHVHRLSKIWCFWPGYLISLT